MNTRSESQESTGDIMDATPTEEHMPHAAWRDHEQFDQHVAVSNSSLPAAPFSRRAPSPPTLHIPALPVDYKFPRLVPQYEKIDASLLPHHEARIITQDAAQSGRSQYAIWAYEQRREAQRLLDFIYLGPINCIRDHAFLEREGITMLILAPDCKVGLNLVDKAVEALGLELHYVNQEGYHYLVQSFPEIVRTINNHLLAVDGARQPDGPPRRGKVLIACETGNGRSATIAAAYIMAVLGQDWRSVCQYITVQRFCVTYDEATKAKLATWHDILQARSQVAAFSNMSSVPEGLAVKNSSRGSKRHNEETDEDRFAEREPFVPFVDGA